MSTSQTPTSETIVAALHDLADKAPERRIFTFLSDGENEAESYDAAGLDHAARRVAVGLRAEGLAGNRVLLAIDPGPDYVAAFLGCLYAGAVAVPCYPPQGNGRSRGLLAIARNCGASAVLTAAGTADAVDGRLGELAAEHQFAVLDMRAFDNAAAGEWTPPAVEGADLAFLQYTSGSTGAPKGVMVRHQDIVRHVGLLYRQLGFTSQSVAVSWVPPFHDMGLIACILMPAVMGYHTVLMAPRDFVLRPARWLRAISRYGAAMSPSPNFGYELCLKRVTDEELTGVDLSRWQHAVNGAEPVQAATVERFAERFGRFGFRPEAMRPAYGLAEATLVVSAPAGGSRPVVTERTAMGGGEPVPPGSRMVGCGHPLDGHQIAIVDPQQQRRCPDGVPGEVWVTGPSVPDGYWNRPEETERTFRATLPGDERRYLRTGDMALLRDGELFVVGRYRDLVIVRGRNYAPSDIEQAVAAVHPGLRAAGTAVFSISPDARERLVVVQEVRAQADTDLAAIAEAIRSCVVEEFEIAVDEVVLVKPGTLPRTTSGKIQRRGCRARYLAGLLEPWYEWRAAQRQQSEDRRPARPGASWSGTVEAMENLLTENLGRVLGSDAARADRDRPFSAQGLDSARGLELVDDLSVLLGVTVPAAVLYDHPSVRDLARHLVEERASYQPTA